MDIHRYDVAICIDPGQRLVNSEWEQALIAPSSRAWQTVTALAALAALGSVQKVGGGNGPWK